MRGIHDRHRSDNLVALLSAVFSGMAATSARGQLAHPAQIKPRRILRPLSTQNAPVSRNVPPRLPAAVSPDILWVTCPAEAESLGATCGKLPVPHQ